MEAVKYLVELGERNAKPQPTSRNGKLASSSRCKVHAAQRWGTKRRGAFRVPNRLLDAANAAALVREGRVPEFWGDSTNQP
jgi:hypothetical protein